MLNALVPFILLPILTRYLTTAEYGKLAIFQTLIIGLMAVIGMNTIGAANRKYFDTDKTGLPEYNGVCIHILLISTLVTLILASIFSNTLMSFLSIPITWLYGAIIISVGTFLIQLRLGQYQVREMAIRYGVLQVSQSCLIFVLTILFVVILNGNTTGRINAILFGTIICAIISLTLLYKDKLIKIGRFNQIYFKDALNYGLPLAPHVIGIFFLSSVDRFFINKILGSSDAGVYMFAVQISLSIAVLFDALNKALVTSLFAILAENNLEKLNKTVRLTCLFFIVVFILGLLSFIIGPLVVELVGGLRFSAASSVIGWLCLGQAFGGMYLMVTNYIFYAKKTGLLSIITISTGFFNIFLLTFFINYKGIEGVAMAFAISMFIRFILTWLLAINVSHFSWLDAFDFKKDIIK